MTSRILTPTLTLMTGLLIGWLLLDTPPDKSIAEPKKPHTPHTLQPVVPDPESNRKTAPASNGGNNFDPNAIPYERLISFKNEADYRDFLNRLGNSKLRNLGQIDRLHAIRLGFVSLADFDALGLDPDQLQYNYPVVVPEQREIEPQSGLVGFGSSALKFLGVTGDNSTWGKGVKIAVIDTGIQPHLALGGKIQHINLIELADGVEPNSHGTSVASLIAGTHPNLKGIAPQADLISVRIADETGYSSSFLLAQGIIAASDAGAILLNISLGSESSSLLVQQAIAYATERGSVIFASSGNSGADSSAHPGADPNVYSVGAVDANGTYVNFSSRDADLALTGPGYEVFAAISGDRVTTFTGTSAAVAFPVGAVAAIMSESNPPLSAQAATEILINHTNEAGAPGADPQYGQGTIDLGRALQRDTPGIIDLAVASQTYLLPDEDSGATSGLQVVVENRGTEAIYQSTANIGIAGDTYPVNIQSLQPNERRVITISAGLGLLQKENQLNVRSEVTLSSGANDAKPANDQRDEIITLPTNAR